MWLPCGCSQMSPEGFDGHGRQQREAGMGKSMDAQKSVKKKAKRSMKEKRQAKREKRNRWVTTP